MSQETGIIRPPVGISACLFGERVRYDGGHKLERQLVETLQRFFALVPVCPEAECGLGTPREAMRLEGDPAAPRLVAIDTRIDLTDRMREYAGKRAAELEAQGLCGFVFKKNSPSSGLHSVKVYRDGVPSGEGRGLFAAEIVRRLPLLPVADEVELAEPAALEGFIAAVLCHSGKTAE